MILKQQFRNYFTSLRRFNKFQEVTEFSNGKVLVIESGQLAKLADGSAVATLGETSVLVTAVNKLKSNPASSFMPLTVDYRQKYAAAGRIPSNYLRRELAPTDKEILTSRVIDRSIRPLFPPDFFHDTQLNCQLLAVDGMQDPDVISINAASAALSVSNIPWDGPVGAVRVGLLQDEVVIFPSRRELSQSDLNLVVAATDSSHAVMLEGNANCVKIQDLKKALKLAMKECQKIVTSIKSLAQKVNRSKKEYNCPARPPEDMLAAIRSLSEIRIQEIFRDSSHSKLSRDNAVNALRLDVLAKVGESFKVSDENLINDGFNVVTKEVFRSLIIDHNVRCDGRSLSEIRPISCEVGLFDPLHGSSLFQRGQTQVQCTVAFDSPDKAVKLDPLLEMTGGIHDKNFLLHYSFPSFANNELSRSGPISRREIGHGALAAKGLRPLLPKENPFCVLLTSTVMESNGSSSMASVCGGSLALMDAGVSIPSHAAGVAIGLISRTDDNNQVEDYRILTDILGIEDYLGDMDFKIAGTKTGVTAIQADIKLSGLPLKVIMEAIDEGFSAKNHIINIMNDVINTPRTSKENLPVVLSKPIPSHKRGVLMSAGGIKLKRIQAESGVQMTWEDTGSLSIFAPNKDSMDEALQLLDEGMQSEPDLEFGSIYTAKIIEIRPQGVMISFYEGMTPVLLHNSQLDVKKSLLHVPANLTYENSGRRLELFTYLNGRMQLGQSGAANGGGKMFSLNDNLIPIGIACYSKVSHPSALGLTEGSEIKVKYFGRDPNSGHMRISRRALLATVPRSRNLLGNQE